MYDYYIPNNTRLRTPLVVHVPYTYIGIYLGTYLYGYVRYLLNM